MKLNEVQELVKGLFEQHGLRQRGYTFEFNNTKARFGSCDPLLKVITLSKHLTELHDLAIVKDVILHEIAHSMVHRNDKHSKAWKAKFKEIGGSGNRFVIIERR